MVIIATIVMMMMILYSLNCYIDIFPFLVLFLLLLFHCLSKCWALSGACESVW